MEPNPEILERAGELAKRLAYEAGALAREAASTERRISYKGATDLVTDADEASEKLIVQGIHAEFPDHRLTGEEGATGAPESDYGWFIDPIDGTTNFAHGYAHWSVSIMMEFRGEPVVGAVYDPMKDEMFFAVKGQGAFLNDDPMQVTAETDLIRALVATGFSYNISERAHTFALWEAFSNASQGIRRGGSAALDTVWVAAGRLDAYFERPVNTWDVGAGVIIAREAGATVTALDGGPYDLYGLEVCCTNGPLHEQVVQLITKTLAVMH
jgi:myo-inositol-1(or 4)-monophosphatase